jgi:hypothetical protein
MQALTNSSSESRPETGRPRSLVRRSALVGKRPRKLLLAALATFGSVLALSLVVCCWDGWSDNCRYWRAVRNMRIAGWLFPVRKVLPASLAEPLSRSLRKPFDHYHKTEEALLASGFLTNLVVQLSPGAGHGSNPWPRNLDIEHISSRLHKALGVSFLPCSLEIDQKTQQVNLVVTCRTQDVRGIVIALHKLTDQSAAPLTK